MELEERRLRAARRILGAGIVVQGATLTWKAWGPGTSLNTLCFLEIGTTEATAQAVDRGVATVGAIAAALVVLGRFGLAGALTAVVFFAQALAMARAGGGAFADLNPTAGAVRWFAPLALFGLAGSNPASVRRAETVLRLAIAATFATHGWEALQHHSHFLDLVIGSARHHLGWAPAEASVGTVLTAIGVVDLAVAVVLVVRRIPLVALWATLWGTTTALSRTLAFGHEFVHETTIRALNGLAPLALWLLWTAARQERVDPMKR